LSTPPPISLDYSFVQFEAMEEQWSEYDFSDGLKVKARVILTALKKYRGRPPGQEHEVSLNTIIVCEAPPDERGQPTPPMSPEDVERAEKYIVRPITHTEPWNTYRLKATDEILKIKYVATTFYKLKDKFDNNGNPIIQVVGGPLITVEPKIGRPLTP